MLIRNERFMRETETKNLNQLPRKFSKKAKRSDKKVVTTVVLSFKKNILIIHRETADSIC